MAKLVVKTCVKCGRTLYKTNNPMDTDEGVMCMSCWGDKAIAEGKIKVVPYDLPIDRPPVGCRACGGDYPNCKTGCNMFDY